MNFIIVGFVLYFIAIAIITLASYLSRPAKVSSYNEFMIGNRSVNYVLTALSAHASDMSDWLFMAFPAMLYTHGAISFWIAFGLIAGMWITWSYIAPQLRKATQNYNAITLSSYFEQRFQDQTGFLRVTSALLCCLFFTIYIAAGFKGFGYLSESLFAIPALYGTGIAALCVLFYVSLGGYAALAWIDAFQALFLLSVIFLVPYKSFLTIGNVQTIIDAACEKNISLSLLPTSWIETVNTILLAISWGVGYFGLPHILTKFMGISDISSIKKSQYIGLVWQAVVLGAAGAVGILAIAYFPQVLPNKELAFIYMVKDLFSPMLTGIILSSVAGATLAVITAQILVIVSVITEDLYRKSYNPTATENHLVWVSRCVIFTSTILGALLSLIHSVNIQQLVHYAWMGFGASFGPLVLISLNSDRITTYGAYAGLISGSVIAMTWHLYAKAFIYNLHGLDIPAVIPGFIISTAMMYGISWCTKNKS